MRILNTRPEDDAAGLGAALEALGHTAVSAPLLTIRIDSGAGLDLSGAAALLATSANGIRAAASLNKQRELLVFAVGDATARTAAALGYSAVQSASGDVEALAGLVIGALDPSAGPLVHAAGTRVAGDLAGRLEAAGFDLRRAVIYSAEVAEALPEAAASALSGGGSKGVVLFSPRTAKTFVELVRSAGLERTLAEADVYCLSRAVADRANDLAWRRCAVAEAPTQEALLKLIGPATPEENKP